MMSPQKHCGANPMAHGYSAAQASGGTYGTMSMGFDAQ